MFIFLTIFTLFINYYHFLPCRSPQPNCWEQHTIFRFISHSILFLLYRRVTWFWFKYKYNFILLKYLYLTQIYYIFIVFLYYLFVFLTIFTLFTNYYHFLPCGSPQPNCWEQHTKFPFIPHSILYHLYRRVIWLLFKYK